MHVLPFPLCQRDPDRQGFPVIQSVFVTSLKRRFKSVWRLQKANAFSAVHFHILHSFYFSLSRFGFFLKSACYGSVSLLLQLDRNPPSFFFQFPHHFYYEEQGRKQNNPDCERMLNLVVLCHLSSYHAQLRASFSPYKLSFRLEPALIAE